MALTTKDISLIKEALQPEFTKVKGEIIHLVINEISGVKNEINSVKHEINSVKHELSGVKHELRSEIKSLEERLGKRITDVESKLGKRIDQLVIRIDEFEVNIENRIQLSEKNIIETQGELHQNHEVRIRRLEKVARPS